MQCGRFTTPASSSSIYHIYRQWGHVARRSTHLDFLPIYFYTFLLSLIFLIFHNHIQTLLPLLYFLMLDIVHHIRERAKKWSESILTPLIVLSSFKFDMPLEYQNLFDLIKVPSIWNVSQVMLDEDRNSWNFLLQCYNSLHWHPNFYINLRLIPIIIIKIHIN
jgi:hypothetical protein